MAPRPAEPSRRRPPRRDRRAKGRTIAVLCALALFGLLSIGPAQSYLSARADTARLHRQVQIESSRRDELRLEAPTINDRSSTIAALRRLGYSFPGEQIFRIPR